MVLGGDLFVLQNLKARMTRKSLLGNIEQDRRAAVESGLDSYVLNVWHRRGIAVFKDPDKPQEASAFVEMLKVLGIERKDIRWYCFKSDAAEKSKFLPKWKRIFGLKHHPEIISPPNKKSSAHEKWFGIAPRLDGFVTRKHSKSPGIFGFRFLMLMGFIAWSREPLPARKKLQATGDGL
jgi:hypothetical protein